MLNAIFSEGLIKKYNIKILNRNYEVRIYDFTFGIAGCFTVRIWADKKNFFKQPDIDFITHENPVEIVKNRILEHVSQKEKYRRILKAINEAGDETIL